MGYHQSFTGQDGVTLKRGLSFDGLHPNAHGYNLMADIPYRTLQQHNIHM